MSSLDLMRNVWPREDLDAKEKSTLLALLQHVDEKLRCWPSIKRLCTFTSIKRRAVQYALGSLESRGFIKVHRGAGKGGGNIYVLQPSNWTVAEQRTDPEQPSRTSSRPQDELDDLGGAPHARGAHNVHPMGASRAPELPMELPNTDEPKGSRPQAALGADQPSLWKHGLRFLIANGVAEKNARSNLGRWRRDYPEPMILAVMSEAERQEVTEPVAWINGALKRRAQNVIPLKREGRGDGTDRSRGIFGAAHPNHRAAPGQAARMLDAARRLGFFDKKP